MPTPGIRSDDANIFELTREALDELPFGVVTLDRSGTIVRFNRAEETLSRRSALRTVGLNFFSDVAPCTNVQSFRGRFDEFAQHHDSGVERFKFSFAFRWGRQDVSITMLRKAGHDDMNILIRGRSMERVADDAEQPAPMAMQRASDEVKLRTIPDAKELSRPVVQTLDPDDESGLRRRVHPDDLPTVRRVVCAAARDRSSYAVEYRGPARRERRIFLEHGTFDRSPDGHGHATIIDVTQQRTLEAESWRAAHYDDVTGLPNAQLLQLRIADAVRESDASGRIVAVLLAKIVEFPVLMQTFGHDAGHAVLRGVAMRLGECVRGGDTVARVGLDCFAVLLTDIEAPESASETAARLVRAVGTALVVDDHPHFISLHVGISLSPYDSRDPVRLMRSAETAIFNAEQNGRSSVGFYSEKLAAQAGTNRQLQSDLRDALARGEFELHYQPLVDITRGRVVAAEALIRWNHPVRGMVSPLEFIPLADRTGLVVPLGEWVLRTACRQARQWAQNGFDLRVCVNVSSVQFAQPGFVDVVARIIDEFEIAPGKLELELTESIMVDGFAEMMETLTKLKTLGLRLAIDDFGTGYSSLSYLKYFPVDTLKVDRAFVNDITSDEYDHAIATAIFTLARNLELECVIEGVETVEQLETLRGIGCNVVQGFLFSKPLRAEHIEGILRGAVPHDGALAAR